MACIRDVVKLLLLMVVANLLALAGPDAAADEPGDDFRDPLPERAVVRIGTNRLQCDQLAHHLQFSADQKYLFTVHRDRLNKWDVRTGKLLGHFQYDRADPPHTERGACLLEHMAVSADGK